MLQIEKGIPMPPARRKNYPLRNMEIGDSFFVQNGNLISISSHASRIAKQLNRAYICRQREEEKPGGDKVTGIRVWRQE